MADSATPLDAMDDDDLPLPRPVAPAVRREELFVHLSDNAYAVGYVLGGWVKTRWAMNWTPDQQRIEAALEKARPPDAPPRDACVYITSHPALVESWIRGHATSRVYKVHLLDGKAYGHVDMRYLDWMQGHDCDEKHAVAYWNRMSNPARVPSWEVLAECVVVLAEADPQRVQHARSSRAPIVVAHLFG